MAQETPRASRPWLICPACEGEGRIFTGEWYEDRDTGAHSQIMEQCDLCGGYGAVENPEAPVERRILTKRSEDADPRFSWAAFRAGDEAVPETWGFGSSADNATLDLYRREREDLEALRGWRSAG